MDFRRTDFRRALNRNRSLLRRPYCCRSYCDSNVRPPTFDKSFDRVGNMNELKNTTSQTSIDSNREDSRAGDNRRTALAKLGLYAAYTAPVMLGMMTAAKAQVASGRTTDCTQCIE